MLYRLADEGTTLFVTTHYMDEAEFCGRISIMHRGKIIEMGEPKSLVAKYEQPDLQEMFISLISGRENDG
jgi:ABC-2 type transport system ATP-binding protein